MNVDTKYFIYNIRQIIRCYLTFPLHPSILLIYDLSPILGHTLFKLSMPIMMNLKKFFLKIKLVSQ